MRRCHFCERWFKNIQAVRRHLGYCRDYLTAESTAPWTREALYQCAQCREQLGFSGTDRVTREEMHAMALTGGGCPMCQTNAWVPAGWRRVPQQ